MVKFQASKACIGLAADVMKSLVNLLNDGPDGADIRLHLDKAFDNADGYALAIIMYANPHMRLIDAVKLARSRHISLKGNWAQLKLLRDAGVLQELITKDDLPSILAQIVAYEKQERVQASGRRVAMKAVQHAYAARPAKKPAAAAAATSASLPGGSRGGGGGPGRVYYAPNTVRPGIGGVIDRLKAPGSNIAVRGGPGLFIVYYDGAYIRSFSWTMRGSTSETLKLSLLESWNWHDLYTSEKPSVAILNQINTLDISRFDISSAAV